MSINVLRIFSTLQGFISLKWKIIISLSLLILAVNTSLSYQSYWFLKNQSDRHLEQSIARNASNFSLMVARTNLKLIQLSSAIVLGMGGYETENSNGSVLTEFIATNWQLLQIEWGLEFLSLLGKEHQADKQWGNTEGLPKLNALIDAARQEMSPKSTILCTDECKLYGALPVLLSGSEQRVLIVGITLADLMIDYAKENNVDVAFLKPSKKARQEHYLAAWQTELVVATNLRENKSILESLTDSISLDQFLKTGGRLDGLAGKDYHFHGVRLSNEDENLSFVVLIKDITESRHRIFSSLRQSLLVSLIGLFLSEILLLAILRRPLARIKQQAELLPLLAKSGFDSVRSSLQESHKERRWPDELDVLADTAVELSHQLESMENEVNMRSEELEQLALNDVLTGLANRRLFMDHLNGAINDYCRNGQTFAVVFMDIDQFKRINDSLGHEVGDKLLIEISSRLQKFMRSTDTVARLGGDEFTLLLRYLKFPDGLLAIIDKILDELRKPINLGSKSVSVTASMGIAIGPDNGLEAQQLMRCADLAMYQVKGSGRNGYHFYTEEMNVQAQQSLELESQLQLALDRDEFILHYQPIFEIGSRRIAALEALVRWQHPQKGLIGPFHFLDAMEDNGQIIALSEKVIAIAGSDLSRIHARYGENIRLSINLSPSQLIAENLIVSLKRMIQINNIPPECIKLEITEHSLMTDMDDSITLLNELKDLGVLLSIDDFGTGYSSLNYLKRLPVDELKVDRSFVMDIPEDSNDMAITSAVIAMAHKLHLKVVAEGIEDESQLDFLKQNSCDYGQGFLFCKPIDIEGIFSLLDDDQILIASM